MFTRDLGILDRLRKPGAAMMSPTSVGIPAPSGASGGRRRQSALRQPRSQNHTGHHTATPIQCQNCYVTDRPFMTTWFGAPSSNGCVHCGHVYGHFGPRRTVIWLWLLALLGVAFLALVGILVFGVQELSIR